jgi:hypothetical protein
MSTHKLNFSSIAGHQRVALEFQKRHIFAWTVLAACAVAAYFIAGFKGVLFIAVLSGLVALSRSK